MAFNHKIMFEFMGGSLHGLYRVVYFTELQDHNKEFEISRYGSSISTTAYQDYRERERGHRKLLSE
jgi:hypothetical protein